MFSKIKPVFSASKKIASKKIASKASSKNSIKEFIFDFQKELNIIFLELDHDFKLLKSNKAFFNFTNSNNQEDASSRWLEMFSKDHKKSVQKLVLSDNKKSHFIISLNDKNGFEYEFKVSLVKSSDQRKNKFYMLLCPLDNDLHLKEKYEASIERLAQLTYSNDLSVFHYNCKERTYSFDSRSNAFMNTKKDLKNIKSPWGETLEDVDIGSISELISNVSRGEEEQFVIKVRLKTENSRWNSILVSGRAIYLQGDKLPKRILGTLTPFKDSEVPVSEKAQEESKDKDIITLANEDYLKLSEAKTPLMKIKKQIKGLAKSFKGSVDFEAEDKLLSLQEMANDLEENIGSVLSGSGSSVIIDDLAVDELVFYCLSKASAAVLDKKFTINTEINNLKKFNCNVSTAKEFLYEVFVLILEEAKTYKSKTVHIKTSEKMNSELEISVNYDEKEREKNEFIDFDLKNKIRTLKESLNIGYSEVNGYGRKKTTIIFR